MRPFLLAAAALLVCASAMAQALTTTFLHDNGGAVGGAIYFDLAVAPTSGITLTRLDLNLSSSPGTGGMVEVLTVQGGRAPHLTNAAAWALAATAAGISALGPGQPTPVPLLVTLPAGTHGLCVRLQGLSHAYTNGGGAVPATFSNSEVTLSAGEASHIPFTAPLLSPRIVNATLTYVVGGAGLASNTVIGQGCIRRFASAYELFATSGAIDLNGRALRWIPAAGGYQLAPGGSWLAPGSISAPVALALGDDDEVAVPLQMGSFPWATGPSPTLVCCANGVVSAGFGNGTGFTPVVASLLSAPLSAVWLQHDFDPSAPGGGPIEVMQDSATVVFTWNNVRNVGGLLPIEESRFQFQFASNGTITLVCQQMSAYGNGYLVGYSPAGPNLDPGPADLSAVVATAPLTLFANDTLPLSLTASTPPLLGSNWLLQTDNIPANGTFGTAIYGLSDPGLDDLTAAGLPGCGLRASLDVLQPFALGGVSHQRMLALPLASSLLGVAIYTTTAVWASPAPNPFGAITANGIRGRLGNL
jgi:hypothetical protein